MWKLTIEQERDSRAGNYTLTERTVFKSESLADLLTMIEILSKSEELYETTYKIEKVGEK